MKIISKTGRACVLFAALGLVSNGVVAQDSEASAESAATDDSGAHLVQYRYTKLTDLPST